jgi:hypothetical protein
MEVVGSRCSTGRRSAYWRSPGVTIGHIDQTCSGSVEEALKAHFKQPDGTSRPGTHWRVGLEHGGHKFTMPEEGELPPITLSGNA